MTADGKKTLEDVESGAKVALPPVDWSKKNLFKALFFAQVTPLIAEGTVRRLEPTDLCHLDALDSDRLSAIFDEDWALEKTKEKPNLVKALLVRHKFTFLWTGCLFGIAQASLFAGPLLLREILMGIECKRYAGDLASTLCTSNSKLYTYGIWLAAASILQNFCAAHQEFALQKVGISVRNSLMCALYRKVLRLSPKGLQAESTGRIVTLMSNDVNKLQELFAMIHNLWAAPVFIIASFVLLYDVIQWSAFIGFACIFIAAPFTFYVAMTLFKVRRGLTKCADERINILNEVFNGMRVIKYYAWENTFAKRVRAIRDREVGLVWKSQKVGALFGVALFSTPVFIAVCSLGTYSLNGNPITASKAYTALALFNMLRFPLVLVPFLLNTLLNALNAIQRLASFMEADEALEYEMDMSEPGTVRVTNAAFQWPTLPKAPEPEAPKGPPARRGKKEKKEKVPDVVVEESAVDVSKLEQEPFELADVDFEVKPGTLTMVVGPVGSGKSTLVSALNKFVTCKSGDLSVSGRVSFCAQQAWILNATVKENILFGQDYDQSKYEKAVRLAQLTADLEILPAGDATTIGERGVTLSGGQKQRVAIARALYAESDIYIFDDPLSAVDNHVGSALFKQVMTGELKSKTVILVTNALQYLPKADQVVVLGDGKMQEIGTYKSLMAKGLEFSKLMKAHGIDNDDGDKKEKGESKPETSAGAAVKSASQNDDSIKEEERAIGNVGSRIYLELFKATGTQWNFVFVVFFFGCEYGTKAFLDYWLTWWATDKFGWTSNEYLLVYFCIFVANGLFVFTRSFILYFFLCRACKTLHERLLSRVLKMPMSFFDTTPSGRIINRFSRDTETIDIVLPGIVVQFMGCIANIITTLVIVCVATKWFTVALPPILLIYIMIQRFYIPACRELQRIESITRSPIYSGLGEATNGVETIRAFRAAGHFTKMAYKLMEKNADAFVTQRLAALWLAIRLRLIGSVIVIAATFLVIQGNVNAGLAGLTLVYALDVTKYMEHGTNMASELETKMNAVERIVQYLDKELESDHETKPDVAVGLPVGWPANGELAIEKLSMRYRPGLPLVLKNLSFTVHGGEKVGICGRTGSGKSSMFVALFRIVEPASGTVRLDGVDIMTLGLRDLRSKMAMIPQDPFMFAGSIRTNLDPFDEHKDDEVWDVLTKVGLRAMVEKAAKKIDMEVIDNGANFSLGQRQLLCMGRALLRQSRVLMMDEATASVDMDSDALIQKTVREAFSHCTTLTIAHRLNTIMDSDKVAFLEDGELSEYGEPDELLKNKNGKFSALVSGSGSTKNEAFLRGLASKASIQRRNSSQSSLSGLADSPSK